jgi:phosphopantothenoylcysteine synthetase/decarboxylase
VEDDTDRTISKAFTKNMKPLIERWERHIIAAGTHFEPGLSKAELDRFAQRASNPADVREFIEKWSVDDVDVEEALPEKEEEEDDDDDDVEVVVSGDEEEEDEEEDDEEMEDFIVDE